MSFIRAQFPAIKPAANLTFNERMKTMQKHGKAVYNLSFGQSPFPIPEVAVETLIRHARDNEYVAVKGLYETRQAICDFHRKQDDMTDLDPDDVIVGPGSKHLIYILMEVISGDVFMTAPSWTTYYAQTQLTNHKCHIVPTSIENGWKLTPERLRESFLKLPQTSASNLLIFCNPDNPTSISYTYDELKALSNVIKRYNVLVLSDEIYSPINFYGEYTSIGKFIPEQTIVSSGFSKWASAGGWRFGYNIYPRKLRHVLDAVESVASNTFSCAPTPVQKAATALLNDYAEVKDYTAHCSRVLRTVAEFTAGHLQEVGVKVARSMGGYYIAPDFEVIRTDLAKRGITTGIDMCEAILEECKVGIMACGPNFQLPHDSLVTRLCFVNFDGSMALDASRRIGLDEDLPQDFVEKFCKPTYSAIKALCTWVKKQRGVEINEGLIL